jgi:CHRD domain
MTTMHAQRMLATALLAAAAAAGCSEVASTPAEPADLVIPVFSHPESHEGRHFGTHMTGAEETPPRPSRAQGQLNLRLQADGTALGYKLLVANIEDVTQAHIHLAPPGVPGPVIAWLYPAAPPAQHIPGRFQGVLAEGVITDADVVGPLGGQGVAALVAAIRAGNAYANVHTVQFPPGEIRGQID